MYNDGTANSRPVGSTATYSCNTGYTLIGVSVKMCGNTGQWSEAETPVCQQQTSKW